MICYDSYLSEGLQEVFFFEEVIQATNSKQKIKLEKLNVNKNGININNNSLGTSFSSIDSTSNGSLQLSQRQTTALKRTDH